MKKYTKAYYIRKPWARTIKCVRQRCNYKKKDNYYNYGGKGIKCLLTEKQCEELWIRDEAYKMTNPSIDRIDTTGNYSIYNCRYIELLDNIGRFHREKTHCKQGHEFNKENTVYYKWKHLIKRKCRICEKARNRRYKEKIRKTTINKVKETI